MQSGRSDTILKSTCPVSDKDRRVTNEAVTSSELTTDLMMRFVYGRREWCAIVGLAAEDELFVDAGNTGVLGAESEDVVCVTVVIYILRKRCSRYPGAIPS